MTLPTHRFGYAAEAERHDLLAEQGEDFVTLLSKFKDSYPRPTFNAAAYPGILGIRNQGNQGACQGFMLRAAFGVCYFLATGRIEEFSAACGYYKSQEKDGIRGDNGSTLNAGQWVATQHGMCLESAWRYPENYNPRQPANVSFPFKLKVSRPLNSPDQVMEAIDSGLPVGIGVGWNNYWSKEIVDSYRSTGRDGGHSTLFWQKDAAGNIINNNSWGGSWNEDGRHSVTPSALEDIWRYDRWKTFIAYAPDQMSFPDPDAIGIQI